MKKLIILLLFCASLISLNGAPAKWFEAPELSKPPKLELGLKDPAWEKALKIPFTKLNDESGDTKKYPTETYWLYAEGALYMGFKCINPASPKLWACSKQPKDNTQMFHYENLEIFVGDMNGGLYYQFAIDSTGNIYDGKRGSGLWNGEQKHKVKLHNGYWTLVIKVPPALLSTIWNAGSFITIDVARNSYNGDGLEKEVTAISPPGHHSPEDRLFLGNISASKLGALQLKAIENFNKEFKNASKLKSTAIILNELKEFAAKCKKNDKISLIQYQSMYKQYIENYKTLAKLRCDVVLNFIFTNGS